MFESKQKNIIAEQERLYETRIKEKEEVGIKFTQSTGEKIKCAITLSELLRRPGVHYSNLEEHNLGNPELNKAEKEGAEIEIKYSGYIKRQETQIREVSRNNNRKLAESLDYMSIETLSMEAREKLNKVKPLTIGQASRIGGVNPADINALLIYLEVNGRQRKQQYSASNN